MALQYTQAVSAKKMANQKTQKLVVGKDPGLLQGPKTDQSLLQKLRETLENGNTFHGKTVNYRKDGTEFIMEWKIFPINNSENRTSHFLAIQRAN